MGPDFLDPDFIDSKSLARDGQGQHHAEQTSTEGSAFAARG